MTIIQTIKVHKAFSKSVESIKRKQIDQEFSNGKGENKKKKFNFQGEMKKFAEEQNADLQLKKVVESVPQVQKVVDSVPRVDDILKVASEKVATEIIENIDPKKDE